MVAPGSCGRDLTWQSVFRFQLFSLLPMPFQDHLTSSVPPHSTGNLILLLGNCLSPINEKVNIPWLRGDHMTQVGPIRYVLPARETKTNNNEKQIWFTPPVKLWLDHHMFLPPTSLLPVWTRSLSIVWSLWEMQNIWPHLRSTESESAFHQDSGMQK